MEKMCANCAFQKIQSEMMYSASMRRLVTHAISNKQNLERAIPDVKIVIDALDADLQKAKTAVVPDPSTPERLGADGSGNLKFGRVDSPMWLPVPLHIVLRWAAASGRA